MKSKLSKLSSAFKWIPTLYFAEGLPYVAINSVAVIMYTNLGLSNARMALYTSLLSVPWIIKPLWSPFVDLLGTKRFWILSMQWLIAVCFALIAFAIPATFFVKATFVFLMLMAFSSATHDIAADGFYMLALNTEQQSFFVGIRNTFYRLANIFGQGILVMTAGLLHEGKIFPKLKGEVAISWSAVFIALTAVFLLIALYHTLVLPKPVSDKKNISVGAKQLFIGFIQTFISFFKKEHIWLILFFLLTYRLGEAQLGKLASPFLLDKVENGGLAIPTSTIGLIYGTLGVIALLCGGILGGIAIARKGLKFWLIPMVLMLNIPDILYIVLAFWQPPVWFVSPFVIIEQFGYGFGFTAYMLFLIFICEKSNFKTAHYAIGTGIMALSMAIPGSVAGWVQQQAGYFWFFVWVCLCTIPGFFATILVRKKLFGTVKSV
jgi:PAT family beta-lactamase induction signal transducer AmpG